MQMNTTSPCVEAHNISKRYSSRVALDQVSFKLGRGEILGVVGPNGAGKTTLLKLVVGLMRPTEGRVEVLGYDSVKDSLRVKELVGFLPEEDALYDDMTVSEYLMYFADLFTLDHVVASERIQTGLGRFSLKPKERIGGLSKGMKRRVSIVRSLIHDPPILVYDEPTAGLDIFSRKEIDVEMEHLRDSGKSIIVSSHDLSHIEEICDRVIILFDSRLILDSGIGDLLAHQPSRGHLVHFLFPERGLEVPDNLRVVQRKGRLYSALAISEDEISGLKRQISDVGGRVLGVSWNRGSLEEFLLQKAKVDGQR